MFVSSRILTRELKVMSSRDSKLIRLEIFVFITTVYILNAVKNFVDMDEVLPFSSDIQGRRYDSLMSVVLHCKLSSVIESFFRRERWGKIKMQPYEFQINGVKHPFRGQDFFMHILLIHAKYMYNKRVES